jgi:twinkle protein
LLGIRAGELVTLCSGTGIGKSSICRELAYHLVAKGSKIGYIALEESVKRSAQGIMAVHMNCPPFKWAEEKVSVSRMKDAFESTLGTGRVVLYDHWGSCESENLIAQIRYMAKAAGCTHIFLDHLSIVVSGLADGDERRIIDNTMTKLRSLVEETGVAMFLVSHLKRPEGRGHEEGAQTSLSHLRGSHAISQLSDAVIGLERDQQDRESANFTTMRVLKNRYTGDTGVACRLEYDKKTGRLSETTLPDEFDFGGDE